MDPDFRRLQQDFAEGPIELHSEVTRLLARQPLRALVEAAAVPEQFRRGFALLLGFGAQTIFMLKDEVLGVKFQLAYFEEAGPFGLVALAVLAGLCRELGLLVLMDAKRGDIGSTFARYLNAYLTDTGVPLSLEADAMTVNPLVGTDTWELFVPYLRRGKGVFLLAYPTAPGALTIMESLADGEPLWRLLARSARQLVFDHGLEREPSNLGLVVGALRPPMGERIREVFPEAMFLVPGIGTQGGSMANALAFTGKMNWALFNVGRSILYAYEKEEEASGQLASRFWEPQLRAAQSFNAELRRVLRIG